MASNVPKLGGQSYNFVNNPPDSLICLICTFVAKDPQQMDCCGKVYCRLCLTKHKKISNKCPQCGKEGKSFKDMRSDRDIKALKVRCNHLNIGCQWVGELRSLQEHLLTCGYNELPCPNKCKVKKRIARMLRKDLHDHVTNKCPKRQFPCQHCNENGEYEERTTTHLKICPKVNVQCPNEWCHVSLLRQELTTHRSTCQYERVPCKYTEVGCEEKPLRKDLKTHEEDNQLHLKIIIERVAAQGNKITTLEARLSSLERTMSHQQITSATGSQESLGCTTEATTNISPFTFNLINYQKHKEYDVTFYSPPFYTSPTGYKLCVRVDANGWSSGKGTHVSVFAHLMKGDNDDSLIWPFTGEVIVELINQLEPDTDTKHHKKVLTVPADSIVSSRVVSRERGAGWGTPEFIPHTELGGKPTSSCQYLKDNTLVFRVSVKVPVVVRTQPLLESSIKRIKLS